MGIPRFFRYITDKYEKIIIENINNLNNLFFDLNCLIHPCVHNVIKRCPILVKKYNATLHSDHIEIITEFEKEVYKEIGDYISYLIDFSKPNKLVYFAIDGVAPRSKMKQQRYRRYRSVMEKEKIKNIENKFNKITYKLDTNCITPGTIFMKKLSNFLKTYLQHLQQKTKIQFILDDSGIRGEGEHKILQFIKNNCVQDVNCIYGLDADLIMLALVCNSDKVYLLREAIHFGKVDMSELLYFNVNLFSEKLYESISIPIIKKYDILTTGILDANELEIEKTRIIKDYICLCFLVGNDFLPHIPGISINNRGIDILLDIYINNYVIKPYYLVNENNTINFIFLKQIITKLYDKEEDLLRKSQKKTDRFRPRLQYNNPLELELSKLNYYPIFNKLKLLKYGYSDWRDKYYKHYFHITNSHKNTELLHDICQNYVDGLQWTCYYYFDKCISYSWFYKYNAGPTLKDLCKYLLKRVYPPSFDDIEFLPFEQLAIVLPKQSNHLWCKSFRSLSETEKDISIKYPNKCKLDLLNHVYLHECEPLLSIINNGFIKNIFSSIKLTKEEKILNEKTELFILDP